MSNHAIYIAGSRVLGIVLMSPDVTHDTAVCPLCFCAALLLLQWFWWPHRCLTTTDCERALAKYNWLEDF